MDSHTYMQNILYFLMRITEYYNFIFYLELLLLFVCLSHFISLYNVSWGSVHFMVPGTLHSTDCMVFHCMDDPIYLTTPILMDI